MSVEQPQDTASVSHQQIAMASGSRHPTDPVYLAHEAEPQILLILVGLPGSGKTTLALALERCSDTSTSDTNVELAGTSRPAPPPRRWVRASQDDAPSRRRQEAERVTREALMSGDNVVVDRCDFDPQYVCLLICCPTLYKVFPRCGRLTQKDNGHISSTLPCP